MESRIQETRSAISWPSVFGGTFVVLAIEATFGVLAAAIFPSMHATTTWAAGPGIWIIILSIIALFFGAKAASHMAGMMRKLDGLYCGLVTFGLSIFAGILMVSMFASSGTAATTLSSMISANATWLFISLILGGIAAAVGGVAAMSTSPRAAVVEGPAAMRPAA
jgi:hypothetical protein